MEISPDGFKIMLELEPDELKAIGYVTAQWAFLDFHFGRLVRLICEIELKKTPPQSLTSDSFKKRRLIWREIIDEADPNDKNGDSLRALIKEISTIEHHRHKVVHSYFDFDPKSPETLKGFSHKNPFGAPAKTNKTKIEKIADKIAKLNARIITWPDVPDYHYLFGNIVPANLRTELLRRYRGDPPEPQPQIPSDSGSDEDLPK
jgi:hypothetical protein